MSNPGKVVLPAYESARRQGTLLRYEFCETHWFLPTKYTNTLTHTFELSMMSRIKLRNLNFWTLLHVWGFPFVIIAAHTPRLYQFECDDDDDDASDDDSIKLGRRMWQSCLCKKNKKKNWEIWKRKLFVYFKIDMNIIEENK